MSARDTLVQERYGLRVGVDLSKPLRSLLDDAYSGFAVAGDFRIARRYYIAAELGNENRTLVEPNIDVTAQGSYLKGGVNYNAYENWFGMSNLLYGGAHLGFSSFRESINSYTIYTTNAYFPEDLRTETREFSGLNAIWLEVQLGMQVELFSNFFLGLNVQLKRLITQKEPDGFANLYIPGFGKVTEGSKFGTGYSYTFSYFIPIFKN
ncbi:DUF6048 family protein [Croceiramulus getboli]